MAIWSPGFYRVEDYATRVRDLAARTPDGTALPVEQPQKNRWRSRRTARPTSSCPTALACKRALGDHQLGLARSGRPERRGRRSSRWPSRLARPHEVRLECRPDAARDDRARPGARRSAEPLSRATDFDTLVDSPIVAGDLDVHDFDVDGRRHYLVDAGERASGTAPRRRRSREDRPRDARVCGASSRTRGTCS